MTKNGFRNVMRKSCFTDHSLKLETSTVLVIFVFFFTKKIVKTRFALKVGDLFHF